MLRSCWFQLRLWCWCRYLGVLLLLFHFHPKYFGAIKSSLCLFPLAFALPTIRRSWVYPWYFYQSMKNRVGYEISTKVWGSALGNRYDISTKVWRTLIVGYDVSTKVWGTGFLPTSQLSQETLWHRCRAREWSSSHYWRFATGSRQPFVGCSAMFYHWNGSPAPSV